MDSQAQNGIQNPTEKLLQDLKEVVEDGEELLRAGVEGLSEKGKAARARLAAALEAAKKTGRKLQQQTVAGARATDSAIRENPYESLAIAFGIGLIVGVLVNRR